MEKDRLKIWFALQEKIDIYIYKEEYVTEKLIIYDDMGNEIPQEDIEYHTEEINFSNNKYYDGKYIYEYYLDFSFIK